MIPAHLVFRAVDIPLPSPLVAIKTGAVSHGCPCFASAYLALTPCLLNFTSHHARTVGKFLLSPSTQQNTDGQFAASLSIRSGRGSGTHDRVYRFVPVFPTAQAALQYALDQGMGYLRRPGLPA